MKRLFKGTALVAALFVSLVTGATAQTRLSAYFIEEFSDTYQKLTGRPVDPQTLARLENFDRRYANFRTVCADRNEYLAHGWWSRLVTADKTAPLYEEQKDCLLEDEIPGLVHGLKRQEVVAFEIIFQKPRQFLNCAEGVSTSPIDHAFFVAVHKRFLNIKNPQQDVEISLSIEQLVTRLRDLQDLPEMMQSDWDKGVKWSEAYGYRDEQIQASLDWMRESYNQLLPLIEQQREAIREAVAAKHARLSDYETEVMKVADTVVEKGTKVKAIKLPEPIPERRKAVVIGALYFTPAMPLAAAYSGVESFADGHYVSGCINLIPLGGRAAQLSGLATTAATASRLDGFVNITDKAFRYEKAVRLGWNESGLADELWKPIDSSLKGIGLDETQRGITKFVFSVGPQAIVSYKTLGAIAAERQWGVWQARFAQGGGAMLPPTTLLGVSGLSYYGENQLGGIPIEQPYWAYAGEMAYQSAPYAGGLWYLGRFSWGRQLALTTQGVGLGRDSDAVFDAWIDGNKLLALSRAGAAATNFLDPAPFLFAIGGKGTAASKGAPTPSSEIPLLQFPVEARRAQVAAEAVPLRATGTDGPVGVAGDGPVRLLQAARRDSNEVSSSQPPESPRASGQSSPAPMRERSSKGEGEASKSAAIIPPPAETVGSLFTRAVGNSSRWLASFRFKSGLSQQELRDSLSWDEATRSRFLQKQIGVTKNSLLYESALSKGTKKFEQEVYDAVGAHVLAELPKLFRLSDLIDEYQYHPDIVVRINELFQQLQAGNLPADLVGSSFDLADGVVMGKTVESMQNQILRLREPLFFELRKVSFPLDEISNLAKQYSENTDPAIERFKRTLGAAPEPPVKIETVKVSPPAQVSDVGEAGVKNTKNELLDVDLDERDAVIRKAQEGLPKLYAWRRVLRQIRRGGNEPADLEALIDASADLHGWDLENINLTGLEKFVHQKIAELETEVREVTDTPETILSGLRATPYTPRVDFAALGIKLGNGENGNGHGSEKTGAENGDKNQTTGGDALLMRATQVSLQTLPDCFVVGSKFKKQYNNLSGPKLDKVNLGLLKIAEWFDSGGKMWRSSLSVSELDNVQSGLFKARIDHGKGGYRIVFSYAGKSGSRKIYLEEVGQHDTVAGGNF